MDDRIILPPLRLKQIWQCRGQQRWVRIQRIDGARCCGWVFFSGEKIDWSTIHHVSSFTVSTIQGDRDCYEAAAGMDSGFDLIRLVYDGELGNE